MIRMKLKPTGDTDKRSALPREPVFTINYDVQIVNKQKLQHTLDA